MSNIHKLAFASLALGLAVAASAQRKPTVTYTVSGSSGDWTLDFDVKNNFNANEGNVYFFGVYIASEENVIGTPANWGQWSGGDIWNNTAYGGSNTNYDDNWITGSDTGITPGTDLSGFQVKDSEANAPTGVQFFAYAAGGTYQGNDNFFSAANPGFEGTANPVPEPATFAALALGALPLIRRRKKA